MTRSIDPVVDLTISELRNTVVVDEERVTVVSVGVQGPAATQNVSAPLGINAETDSLEIIPGTINGQGLIWDGEMWVQQVVVPAGDDGLVPFKAGDGFDGDGANFRYDSEQQALSVPFLNNTVIDGGNF